MLKVIWFLVTKWGLDPRCHIPTSLTQYCAAINAAPYHCYRH